MRVRQMDNLVNPTLMTPMKITTILASTIAAIPCVLSQNNITTVGSVCWTSSTSVRINQSGIKRTILLISITRSVDSELCTI